MSPDADDPTPPQWWDEASYYHLFRSDRAELDWAFACRHASMKSLPLPQIISSTLCETPPIQLLSVKGQTSLPSDWGLRFRETRKRRKRLSFLARDL